MEAEADMELETELLGVAKREVVAATVTDSKPEPELLAVPDTLAVPVAVPVGSPVADTVAVPVAVPVGSPELLRETEALPQKVEEPLRRGLLLLLTVTD